MTTNDNKQASNQDKVGESGEIALKRELVVLVDKATKTRSIGGRIDTLMGILFVTEALLQGMTDTELKVRVWMNGKELTPSRLPMTDLKTETEDLDMAATRLMVESLNTLLEQQTAEIIRLQAQVAELLEERDCYWGGQVRAQAEARHEELRQAAAERRNRILGRAQTGGEG